ncbi:glutathione S-transferase family protein [Advenella kashmirensis]
MITLHHLEASRSFRIIWLLEELELSYQIERHERHPETMRAQSALKAIHPLGKAPVLFDNGFTLIESGAIIEYLLNRYDTRGLRPPICSEDYLRYSQWMHFAEGSLMPPALLTLVLNKMANARVPFFARSIVKKTVNSTLDSFVMPDLNVKLDFLDTELGNTGWFCGSHFSAADIQMGFALQVLHGRGLIGDNLLNIKAFLEAIRLRPAYQRAKEKAGLLTLSLPGKTEAQEPKVEPSVDAANASAPTDATR